MTSTPGGAMTSTPGGAMTAPATTTTPKAKSTKKP
jgi:hypothetical protein